MYEVVSSKRVYEGQIVAVRVDEVRMPDGSTAEREVVEHADARIAAARVTASKHHCIVAVLPWGAWLEVVGGHGGNRTHDGGFADLCLATWLRGPGGKG